ncbi:MAG: sugar ABC transporter ATP-binding protein [Atribacterota bacterium]|nr:sugar ABC transporter ATP-binding protein [Atribacterota bacterium]
MEDSSKILSTKSLTKIFPGVLAVDDVSFDLLKGEIHGLVGENGAGKSTFVKMLDGSYRPDGGKIILNGQEIKLNSPQEATKNGIGMVYQELMLLSHLSIAENICLPWLILEEKKKIDWKELFNIASKQLKKLGIIYNVREKVSNLTVAQQQIVSIARALASNCQLLILDEPTSALPKEDVSHLFEVMKKLKKQNVAMIFISHRLEEVLEIADRLTVLRDSRKVGTYHIGDLTEEKIAELIVGRPVKDKYPKIYTTTSDKELLRLKNINVKDKLFNISLNLKKGEILGVAGALGAGKTELALTLFGAYKLSAEGEIFLENRKVSIKSPEDAIKKGIALVPEDRRGLGLILNSGIRFNISLPILRSINRCGFIKNKEENEITKKFIEKMKIKCTSMEQRVDNLSGGNQQKVVLSKWLAAQSKLVIMDEPTRGIDVGAKVEIYKLVNELSKQGISIIFLSSEVPEIYGMSDRIIVLYQGKIVKEVNQNQTNELELQRLVLSGR